MANPYNFILRTQKGSALTHQELDDNFRYLDYAVQNVSGGTGSTTTIISGGSGTSLSGNPNEILYFDVDGSPTSSSNFIRGDGEYLNLVSGVGITMASFSSISGSTRVLDIFEVLYPSGITNNHPFAFAGNIVIDSRYSGGTMYYSDDIFLGAVSATTTDFPFLGMLKFNRMGMPLQELGEERYNAWVNEFSELSGNTGFTPTTIFGFNSFRLTTPYSDWFQISGGTDYLSGVDDIFNIGVTDVVTSSGGFSVSNNSNRFNGVNEYTSNMGMYYDVIRFVQETLNLGPAIVSEVEFNSSGSSYINYDDTKRFDIETTIYPDPNYRMRLTDITGVTATFSASTSEFSFNVDNVTDYGTRLTLGSDALTFFGSGSTNDEKFKVSSFGGLALEGDYGSQGQVLTSNGPSSAPTWDNILLSAGTYDPTPSSMTNIFLLQMGYNVNSCKWTRINNIVTVSGLFRVSPTASGGTLTSFDFELPIASNLANKNDCTGMAVVVHSTGTHNMQITSNVASDLAHVEWYANVAGFTMDASFTFTYILL